MAREIDYRRVLEELARFMSKEADHLEAASAQSDHVAHGACRRLRQRAAEASGFLKAAALPPFEEAA